MKTETEEEILKKANRIRERREKEQRDAWNKENELLVGRCFVYENSYGHGDSWPLYRQILGTSDGCMRGFKFEKTSTGIFEAGNEDICYHNDNWREITYSDYMTAWGGFLSDLKEAARYCE